MLRIDASLTAKKLRPRRGAFVRGFPPARFNRLEKRWRPRSRFARHHRQAATPRAAGRSGRRVSNSAPRSCRSMPRTIRCSETRREATRSRMAPTSAMSACMTTDSTTSSTYGNFAAARARWPPLGRVLGTRLLRTALKCRRRARPRADGARARFGLRLFLSTARTRCYTRYDPFHARACLSTNWAIA